MCMYGALLRIHRTLLWIGRTLLWIDRALFGLRLCTLTDWWSLCVCVGLC